MKIKNKGFLQLPIIIAFIIGSVVFGGTGYLLSKHPQNKNTEQIKVATSTELVKGEKIDLSTMEEIEIVKTQVKNTSNTKKEPLVSTLQKQEVDSNLKIAKCKASQQEAHNSIVTTTNGTIDKAEKDEFEKLNQQMQQRFDEVYAMADKNKATIANMQLSPSAGTSLISGNTSDTSMLISQIRSSYQTAWYNRKNELEIARKTAIEKADQILDQGYLSCLNQ